MKYFLILLLFLLTFPLVGFAFDETHLKKFKSLNQCEKCDLSSADLQQLKGNKAILNGANLSNANLSNANLTYANLTDAKLNEGNINKKCPIGQ